MSGKKRFKFNIKKKLKEYKKRFTSYIKRLLFPIYYFPLKLVTYSTYYLIKFLIRLIISLLIIIIDCIKFPFRSLKNLLKSLFIIGLLVYVFASVFVMTDYIKKEYGWYGKFFCSLGAKDELKRKVVRIVGGYSEGTGFFIAPNQIITNFHVIADEPSPKIIFPSSMFITPVKIIGNQEMDLAVLFTEDDYPYYVLELPDEVLLYEDEPLIATGYPLGTTLTGEATILKGNFLDFRKSKYDPLPFIQTSISLVQGMSGGPMTDQCGAVMGINTLSVAGMSFFINADEAKAMIPDFTDQGVVKINVDPSKSPADAVTAFYTYLKARRMEDGFKLLSRKYLEKTDYIEWTSRFTDVLDVSIFLSETVEGKSDTVFVKFSTKNWVNNEAELHFYEGEWQTVLEDGVYKMNKSMIKEVEQPDYGWFYNIEE